MNDLPQPDSPELNSAVSHVMKRAIYRVLYQNQEQPLSIDEIRDRLVLGPGEQSDLGRRLRELREVFDIPIVKKRYTLKGWQDKKLAGRKISKSLRALVLSDGRCAYCGKTPLEDKVRLDVDHKIPHEWGGTEDRDNLQPLCSECNEGKKNLWADYDQYKDKVKEIIRYDEPHRRIGELLKAFGDEPIPDDLLEMVAKTGQYQKDWTRRLRELKVLGWKYKVNKKRIGGRVRSSFTLEHYEPWPEGSIHAEIRRREVQRKQTRESD